VLEAVEKVEICVLVSYNHSIERRAKGRLTFARITFAHINWQDNR